MTLAKAKLASSITFIVLASFTIVTYDHQNMFIIQATEKGIFNLFQYLQEEHFNKLDFI
jgi:hypothetical protein